MVLRHGFHDAFAGNDFGGFGGWVRLRHLHGLDQPRFVEPRPGVSGASSFSSSSSSSSVSGSLPRPSRRWSSSCKWVLIHDWFCFGEGTHFLPFSAGLFIVGSHGCPLPFGGDCPSGQRGWEPFVGGEPGVLGVVVPGAGGVGVPPPGEPAPPPRSVDRLKSNEPRRPVAARVNATACRPGCARNEQAAGLRPLRTGPSNSYRPSTDPDGDSRPAMLGISDPKRKRLLSDSYRRGRSDPHSHYLAATGRGGLPRRSIEDDHTEAKETASYPIHLSQAALSWHSDCSPPTTTPDVGEEKEKR